MPSIPVEPEGPLPNGVSESIEPDEPLANGVGGRMPNTERKKELCTTCQTLNLSAERFIIDDDPSLRSQKVRNAYLSRPDKLVTSEFSLKSKSKRKCLGDLLTIQQRRVTCPFCSLVIQSVESKADYNISGVNFNPKCYANWEVDGRGASYRRNGQMVSRTRRIHLVWNDKRLLDSYLVFVAPERYLRPNSDAYPTWGNEELFLGRNIEANKGNQALIKSWLELCCKTHPKPCHEDLEPCSDEFAEMISQSYFGVIDVQNMQLTPLPYTEDFVGGEQVGTPIERRVRNAPYVALSYVWGQGKPYTTTLSNIILHRSHGGLEYNLTDLPRVFLDAFNLVRCLDIRYIWIDSLCIVQDSTRSWNLNSRVMDIIYGNAKLTICAADGTDSSAGLRALHPEEHDVKQIKEDCAPGVCLMVSRPPEMGIRASKWNERAWTFQERLLSKRSLIFTDGRVYFQCRSTGMSEDIYVDREGAGWSLDLVHAPLQMLNELDRRALWVYCSCVPLYTSRVLTKPKDILAAFKGICNVIQKTMQAPFIFGLPSSHLDVALLWEPQSALRRRVPRNDKERAEYGGVQFPSWSWCGWTSDDIESPCDHKSEYNPLILEGCLSNVYEWLMKHTWIRWYIRDGQGNLRPLWDKDKSLQDKSTEKRWKGYKGHHRVTHVVPDAAYDQEEADGQQDSATIIVIEKRFDDYGRVPSTEMVKQERDDFVSVLPENPYRVVMAKYNAEPDKEFPDQPILQFFTYYKSLRLIAQENLDDSNNLNPVPRGINGLCRYDIADDIGDWCGSIVVDEKRIPNLKSSQHEFIAISEAKAFTQEECDTWTYYIPKERDQSEWDLYYVLLIKRTSSATWERVALGKVFKAAFEQAEWREIMLG